jgi:hypothetical protein
MGQFASGLPVAEELGVCVAAGNCCAAARLNVTNKDGVNESIEAVCCDTDCIFDERLAADSDSKLLA